MTEIALDESWLADPQPHVLEFRRAGLRYKQQPSLLMLEDLSDFDVDALRTELKRMSFVIAAQVRETLVNAEGMELHEDRIVGALWGAEMEIGSRTLADTFEVHEVASSPAYRAPVEDWLFRQLRLQMAAKGWRHLTMRTPVGDDDDFMVTVAQLQGFAPRDVKHGEIVWQWPADEDGIDPLNPNAA